MVTQELARKKQQEFENNLLQNLQHVFILSEPCPLSPCTSVSPQWESNEDRLSLTWGLRETDNSTRSPLGRACPSAVSHLGWGAPALRTSTPPPCKEDSPTESGGPTGQ